MKRFISITFLLIFSGLILSARDSYAQEKKYGIFMHYVQGYTTYQDGELCSNIIKVNNNTDKDRAFTLRTIGPPDWRSLGMPERHFSIAAHDSIFVPIRVVPYNQVNGGKLVRFKSSLYNEGIMISAAEWIIEANIIHQWTARVMKNETHFLHDSDSSYVELQFENNGNVDEEIDLSYMHSKSLEVYKSPRNFMLKRGKDTTLRVDVRIVKDKTLNAAEIYDAPKRSFEKYNLKFKAIALGSSNIPWQRSATFTKVNSKYKVNDLRWDNIPLTFDFQLYDMLSENPYASLGLYGIKHIDDEHYFTYNIQLLGAAGQTSQLSSNYQNINYYSPTFRASVGHVNDNRLNAMTMHGRGALLSKTFFDQHTITGLYTRSNDFWSSKALQSASLDYGFKAKDNKFSSNLYVQHKINPIQNLNRSLVGLQSDYRFMVHHRLSLQTDFSRMVFQLPAAPDSHNGFGMRAVYSGRFLSKLNVGANYQYTSKNFVYFAGSENLKTFANYRLKDDQMLMAHYIRRKYAPNMWRMGKLVSSGLRSQQQEGKLSYRFRIKKQSLSFYSQYSDVETDSYLYEKAGIGIDYLNTLSLKSRINSSFSMWRNDFNLNSIGAYNTMLLSLSYRQNNFRLAGHYYYGARYISEHMQYAETKIIPRSYYLNANYEFWTGKNKDVLINLSSNLNYRSAIDRFQFGLRPRLNYYVSPSLKLKAYMSILFFDQGDRYYSYSSGEILSPGYQEGNFEMGVGFTKDIGLPISKEQNFDVYFKAFRDDNGNGQCEGNEINVSNMLIVAHKLDELNALDFESYAEPLEVLTNKQGEAVLQNMEQGSYRIEVYPLEKTESWFSERTFSITVLEDRTVMLPQSKGGRIYGSIHLETDVYTRFEKGVSLENIKVSAEDSLGMVYSCLTDKNGSYVLYAPMGAYKLYVNEALFSGSFELTENNIPVSLNHIYTVVQKNFFVKEKERKIVIKKFSSPSSIDLDPSRTENTEEIDNSSQAGGEENAEAEK